MSLENTRACAEYWLTPQSFGSEPDASESTLGIGNDEIGEIDEGYVSFDGGRFSACAYGDLS